MKTILIAEDDTLTRSLLKSGLGRALGCSILMAGHGAEAIQILNTHSVDLLITDLRMPVVDGFELIAFAAEHHPALPILVITSLQEAEHSQLGTGPESLQIFHKPLRMSKLLEAIEELWDAHPAKGSVRGISLTGILQLLELEQKNATVEVREGPSFGRLYLHRGTLIHAAFEKVAGPAALKDLLGMKNPSISFLAEEPPAHRTVYTPLTELLLNAALHHDQGSVSA